MSATATKGSRRRGIKGSAIKAFVRMNSTPIEAYREVVSNAMTYMHVAGLPMEQCVTHININVGNSRDVIIQAPGTGIKDYDSFVDMGHDMTDPEYLKRLQDPEFLSQIGIGINSLLSLSEEEDGVVEFHSVSMDEKERTIGLIAIMRYNATTGEVTFDEPPDKWFLENPTSDKWLPYCGLKVVVKKAKQYTVKKLSNYLATEFARKLVQGYRIHVIDESTGEERYVQPPDDFCSRHEKTIGHLSNGFPVRADLHSVDKQDDCRISVLVKKMPMDSYLCDYMCKGYIMCDCLEFTPNRKGLMKENVLYLEIDPIIKQHCINEGFALKSKPNPTQIKDQKKWIEKAKEKIIKYNRQHPNQELLELKALKENNEDEDETGKGWDEKENEGSTNVSINKTPKGLSKRKNKKHNHHRQIQRIRDDNKDSIPELDIMYQYSGMDRPMVFIDIEQSAIVINLDYEWAKKLARANDETMDLAISHAIVEAYAENKNISAEELSKQYWELVNA